MTKKEDNTNYKSLLDELEFQIKRMEYDVTGLLDENMVLREVITLANLLVEVIKSLDRKI